MTHASNALPKTLRLLALTAALLASAAWADEYSDVNQLLRSGKHAEAMAKADQYLASKPRDPQMRFLKGVIQTGIRQAGDAITTFNKLTEDYRNCRSPTTTSPCCTPARASSTRRVPRSRWRSAPTPATPTAHENLGDVYAKLASQAYSKALQLDAGNTGVQPKLALIRELFAPTGKATPASARAPAPAPAPVAVAKGADAAHLQRRRVPARRPHRRPRRRRLSLPPHPPPCQPR
jgi:hypothetical protein